MATNRYTVQCESCEADVTLKTSAAGTKVDCPKCKYRFVAPRAPAAADDAPDDKAGKGKAGKTPAKKSAGKKGKKSGNSTVLIGGLLGVLAVCVLAAGAFVLFAGGDEKPSGTGNTFANNSNTNNSPGGSDDPGTGDPDNGTGTTPVGVPDPGPTPQPALRPTSALLDATNLLPGESTAVLRVNVPQFAGTPFFGGVFDSRTRELFRESMGFEVDLIDTFIHCRVGPDNAPFSVVRTNVPINDVGMYDRMKVNKPADSPINSKHYFVIEASPFIDAVGRAFAGERLLDGSGPKNRPKPNAGEATPLAICVLGDLQTILISTQPIMSGFLKSLDKDGYPPYVTELVPEPTPPPPPKNPDGTSPDGMPPEGMGGGEGFPGEIPGGASEPGRETPPISPDGTPMSPSPDAPPPPPKPPVIYTSVPTYRTVARDLKRSLNQLEGDPLSTPGLVLVQRVDQRAVATQTIDAGDPAIGEQLRSSLESIQIIGASLTAFEREQMKLTGLFEYANDDAARSAVFDKMVPLLNLVRLPAGFALGTQFLVRNNVPDPNNPLVGQPGGPGGGGEGFGPEFGGSPPGFEEFGPGGGSEFPPGGSFPGGPQQPPVEDRSYIDIALSDRIVTLAATVNWREDKYADMIRPVVNQITSQVKGRLGVFSGGSDWHALAAGVAKITDRKRPFPPGALPRPRRTGTFRLPYPPDERVSFLADLLPYLGQGTIRSQVNADNAWYDESNRTAGESWVPEFLVPYYSPNSWRAYDPRGGTNSYGGTNYAGLAGLGLDAARLDPTAKANTNRVGMTGYDWSSTPEEVTDGLSNTIYMVQLPPGSSRPWIAGGGSTLVGVDTSVKNPLADFVHQPPSGKAGTHILMGDGSVRFLSADASPELFQGLVTRAGGESLADLDKVAPKEFPKGQQPELRGQPVTTPIVETPMPTPAGKVDDGALTKLQGRWKATAIDTGGKALTTAEIAAANLSVSFNGKSVTIGKGGTGSIVGLESGENRATIDILGPGETSPDLGVYDMPSPDRLRIRIAQAGKGGRPTAVDKGQSSDSEFYVELERQE